MKLKHTHKYIGILIILLFFSKFSYTQQSGKSFELSENLSSSSTYNYKAREYIRLLPGFNVKPNSGFNFIAGIDKTVLCNSEYSGNSINDPLSANYPLSRSLGTGDVGVIPGSFDISPMGGAVYQIPIEVPQGVGGMIPSLSVGYNSQAGNGIMGIGWNLSGLSSINRTGRTIYHDGIANGITLDDISSRLMLDGQRLFSIDITKLGLDGTEFRTENESFLKITKQVSGVKTWFNVESKDGKTLEYGSGTEDDGQLNFTGTSKGMVWMLKKVTDKFGNYIKYYYNNDSQNGQISIKQIEYSGGNLIQFGYNKRDDNWSGEVLTGKVSQNVLLAQINTFSAGKAVSKYKFNYYMHNGYSTLYEIVKENGNGQSLNTTAFVWSKPQFSTTPSYIGSSATEGDNYVPGDFTGDGIPDILTLNASSCFLNIGSSNGIITGTGQFNFTHSDFYYNWSSYFPPNALDCWESGSPCNGLPVIVSELNDIEKVLTGDFDGDGKLELMIFNKEYEFDPTDLCAKLSTKNPSSIISALLQTRNLTISGHRCRIYSVSTSGLTVKTSFMADDGVYCTGASIVDFNQDGKTDVVYNGKVFTLNPTNSSFVQIATTSHAAHFENSMWCDINGDGILDFINEKTIYSRVSLSNDFTSSNTFNTDETPLGIIDYNGDGKSEIAVLGKVEYREDPVLDPITGMPIIDQLTGLPQVERILLGKKLELRKGTTEKVYDFGYLKFNYPTNVVSCDINADGFADLALFNNSKLISIYYKTESGYDNISLNATVGSRSFAGDFTGDGIDEIVAVGLSGVRFTTGMPGQRITGIIDGFNRKTSISYKPLTNSTVYSKQQSDYFPIVNLVGPLGVVSQIETPDGVNGTSTTTFYYEGGKIHMQGKGFLGFARITRSNSTNNQSSVSITTLDPTYFTVKKQTEEVYNGSTKISQTITDYEVSLIDGKRIFLYPKEVESKDFIKNNTVKTTNTYSPSPDIALTNQKVTYNGTESSVEKIFESYNSFGNPRNITTKLNRKDEIEITQTQAISYNGLNGSVEQTVANGVTTDYTYDSFGNVNSVKRSGSNVDSRLNKTDYDASGRFPVKQTNALDQFSTATYDHLGNPLIYKDINNKTTTNGYNGWGQLTSSSTPDAHALTSSIAWAGGDDKPIGALYYTSSTRDGLFFSSEYFDILGRTLRKVTTGFNGTKYYTDTKYNEKGQVVEQSEPYSANGVCRKTTFTYDSHGRVNVQTLPNSSTITYGYSNNTITQTYSTGEEYSKTYDASGLLISSTDPGGTITYDYLSNGRNYKIVAPGSTISMKYNDYGLQTQLLDPDAGETNYTYNAFGELETQTNAMIKKTTLTYDKLGRVLTKEETDNTSTYKYDDPGYLGLLMSITGTTKGKITYTYDDLGQMVSENRIKGSENLTFSYEHDSKGRISKMIYPSGFAVTYEYNSHDDLIKVYDASNLNSPIWKIDNVDAKGRIHKATYGNGKQITYGYDANDRPNSIFVDNIIDFTYFFNSKNQLDWRKENYFESGAWNGFQEDFTYDEVNRLETTKIGGNLISSISYASGVNDRFDTKSDVGKYSYNAGNHRLNLITPVVGYPQPTQHDLTFTSSGKVATITEGTKIISYEYGLDDQRFKSVLTQGGNVQYNRYYFNEYEKETNADGSLKQHLNYIYAGGGLVAIYVQKPTGNAMHYVYNDYLGSLRCITDANGNIEQKLSYDAWGNRRNPITGVSYTTPPSGLLFARGFTGHEHLDAVGLINMNARIYDPSLGMFISPDNYLQAPDFTQNFNRYTYGLNNPLMYTDPDGNMIWFVIAGYFAVRQALVSGSNYSNHGGNFWKGFGRSIAVSAVSMAVGFGTGALIGSCLPNAATMFATESSAFFYGALGGSASGGLSGGITNSIFGGNFRDGFISGAIFGGIMGGISSVIKYNELHDFVINRERIDGIKTKSDGSLNPSKETLNKFSEEYYKEYKYREKCRLLYDNDATTKMDARAFTKNILIDGKYNVTFGDDAFTSKWQLFLTMGHEYVHVANYINIPFNEFDPNISEWGSYKYQSNLTKSVDKGWFNYYEIKASKKFTPNIFYNSARYTNYNSWGLPTSIPLTIYK